MLRFCVALAAGMAVLTLLNVAWAAPPPVEAYGKLPGVEEMTLSPSGQLYAFIAVIGEKRQLVAATVDDQKPVIVAEIANTKVVDIQWAGEDRLLVTVSQTVPLGIDFTLPKQEFLTVVVINLKTKKVFRVFDNAQGVEPVVVGRYGAAEIKGRWYGYFGGITLDTGGATAVMTHGWPDLYRVDLDSGALSMVARGSEDTQDWLVGPDGEVIARSLYRDETGVWEVRAGAVGGKLLASGQSKLEGIDRPSRGRTPDTIVINRPAQPGPGWVYQELPLSGAPPSKTPEYDRADDIMSDPKSALWVGTVNQGDQRVPTFFDPIAEARVKGAFKAFPGLSVELVSFTPDLRRMIVETSGKGDSGAYWLVDITTHKADPVGYQYPQVGPDDVGTIEMVDWKAADGLALRGVLNLPAGREAKNLPVIVMPHGGPEDRDYPKFDWWAQLFASRGYAVFQPNFRGSSGYGVGLRDAGFGQIGRKMQTDVSDGLAALAEQGVVDPKRACIVGWSYGGYAAQAGVTVQQGLYRCAVSMAGLSDLSAFLNYVRDEAGAESASVRYWKTFMGVTSFWENELKPISPAKMAARADAPILLIHGKDDTVVPIGQSQEMERALKAAGKPVELVTLPNADHWLLHEDTRLAMAKASLDFVLKYDPPDPEPAAIVAAAKP